MGNEANKLFQSRTKENYLSDYGTRTSLFENYLRTVRYGKIFGLYNDLSLGTWVWWQWHWSVPVEGPGQIVERFWADSPQVMTIPGSSTKRLRQYQVVTNSQVHSIYEDVLAGQYVLGRDDGGPTACRRYAEEQTGGSVPFLEEAEFQDFLARPNHSETPQDTRYALAASEARHLPLGSWIWWRLHWSQPERGPGQIIYKDLVYPPVFDDCGVTPADQIRAYLVKVENTEYWVTEDLVTGQLGCERTVPEFTWHYASFSL